MATQFIVLTTVVNDLNQQMSTNAAAQVERDQKAEAAQISRGKQYDKNRRNDLASKKESNDAAHFQTHQTNKFLEGLLTTQHLMYKMKKK